MNKLLLFILLLAACSKSDKDSASRSGYWMVDNVTHVVDTVGIRGMAFGAITAKEDHDSYVQINYYGKAPDTSRVDGIASAASPGYCKIFVHEGGKGYESMDCQDKVTTTYINGKMTISIPHVTLYHTGIAPIAFSAYLVEK